MADAIGALQAVLTTGGSSISIHTAVLKLPDASDPTLKTFRVVKD
ncbi:hypothetical protein [Actinoplanes sp. NPDC023714]